MVKQHPSSHFSDLTRPNNLVTQKLLSSKHGLSYTYKARGAIYQILNSLDKANFGNTVLAPAYHCPTVIQPILMAGFKVRYFGVKDDFTINQDQLLQSLDESVAAVIIINYFGFPQNIDGIKAPCHQTNSIVIEDCSHSFVYNDPLELSGDSGDCAVYSFWKLLPSYAGGGIRINDSARIRLRPSEISLSTKGKLKALKTILEQSVENMPDSVIKTALLGIESLRVNLKTTSIADNEDQTPPVRNVQERDSYTFVKELFSDKMLAISSRIIAKADLYSLIESRRKNYKLFGQTLKKSSNMSLPYPELPPRVCPWGFPLLIPNRSQYDYKLRQAGVSFFTFGEELHGSVYSSEISNNVRAIAKELSASVLCLSIHQDIDETTLLKNARITNMILS